MRVVVVLLVVVLAGCFVDDGPSDRVVEGGGGSVSSGDETTGTTGGSEVLETTTGPYGSAGESGGGTGGLVTTGISGTGSTSGFVPETTGDVVCGIQPESTCQEFLAYVCCDLIPNCLEDEKCACLLGCAGVNNDPQGCMIECEYLEGPLVDCMQKECAD